MTEHAFTQSMHIKQHIFTGRYHQHRLLSPLKLHHIKHELLLFFQCIASLSHEEQHHNHNSKDMPTLSTPTLSPLNIAIEDRWLSLMKQTTQQTIEKACKEALQVQASPTTSPAIKESESPSSFPSVDLIERLQFDYDPLSIVEPQPWGKIDAARSKCFNVIDDKTNNCDIIW